MTDMRLGCIPPLALVAIIGQLWIAHVCTGTVGVPADFVLLTSNRRHVNRLDLPSTNTVILSRQTGRGRPYAVAYDPFDMKVYWTDTARRQIRSAGIDGTNRAVFKRLGRGSIPEGLAVDPVSGLVFYTDRGRGRIVAVAKDGSSEQIINTGLTHPQGIALDPCKKKMYWTDCGSEPKIECANFDGTERTTLINTGVTFPNGITLDITGDKMYWTDAGEFKIEGANIDGSNRQTILADNTKMFLSLAFYQNDLYFTDSNAHTQLHVVPVTGGPSTPVAPNVFNKIKTVYYHQESLLPQGGGLEFRCAAPTGTFCNAISNAECVDGQCQCMSDYRGDRCSTTCTSTIGPRWRTLDLHMATAGMQATCMQDDLAPTSGTGIAWRDIEECTMMSRQRLFSVDTSL